MDVQQPHRARLSLGRFFAHNTLRAGEGRTAAAVYCALTFFVALLFARTHAWLGVYPFAIAYLCALDRRVPFAYLGALLGALTLGERGYVYAALYLLLLGLRLLLSLPRGAGKWLPACHAPFEEDGALRVAAACAGGLLLALYQLTVGGLATLSLAFAVLMLLLPVGACLLYLGFFQGERSLLFYLTEEETSPSAVRWWLACSLGGLAFTVVRGLVPFSLLGIAPSLVLAGFFCLLFPYRFGLLRGGAAALLSALGACLSSETVFYIPALAAVALSAALLARLGGKAMLLGAAAAGMVLAYLLAGTRSLLSFVPELLICLALSWPLFHALPHLRAAHTREGERARAAAQTAVRAMAPGGQRMVRFAEAFDSLGEVFARLAGGRTQMENGRIDGGRNELLEKQWRLSALLLRDAAAREAREAREDPARSRAAARVFEEMGASARQVSVFGCRTRLLLAGGVRWEADHPAEEALRRRLEEVCGCALSAPVLSLSHGVTDMRYTAASRLSLSYYTASTARGGEVSGDAFSLFYDEHGRAYALLSDGMGSGPEAAITAGLCLSFLSGVLTAGAGKGAALDALNMLLSSREGECTATVDLCEIDLRSGACRFHKCGAAASYVRRGDSLFHIPAGRLPLGVLEEVDVEKTTVHLQAGDRVILLSDGVSQTPEDAPWLCELLSDRWEDDPEIMADRILNTARAHAEQSDDRTVVIIEIKGKRE